MTDSWAWVYMGTLQRKKLPSKTTNLQTAFKFPRELAKWSMETVVETSCSGIICTSEFILQDLEEKEKSCLNFMDINHDMA